MQDDSIVIDGIKIYGTPYCPNLSYYESWMSFVDNKFWYRSPEMLQPLWQQIPDDTNILITHAPPRSILDGNIHGCPHLMARVLQLKQLKLHMFGHVHPMYGVQDKHGITFINAALEDEEQPMCFTYNY